MIGKDALRPGDILVVSSKAVATIEGVEIRLDDLTPTPQAHAWSGETGLPAPFLQAVMKETERLNGRILGASPGALLTELRPDGFPRGVLLVPNAGLDQSNVREGYAVGWPVDPVQSVKELRKRLKAPVILSDSCCHAGRLGVTAMALACAGIDPIQSLIGKKDAFGREMKITQEAVADQLATAANMVMGNADQGTPAAIVREHGFALSEYEGWVEGMEPGEDLFRGMFRNE